MAVEMGPVQLVVFGFDRPKFGGGITAELNRLREKDIVRVIDALVIHKNAQGDVRTVEVSELNPMRAGTVGAIIGTLLGMDGQDGDGAARDNGAERSMENSGPKEMWDVLDDIPNDSAAALLLLEHRWAIPFRDAIWEEHGMAVGDIWLHPFDLLVAGLISEDTQAPAERQRVGR